MQEKFNEIKVKASKLLEEIDSTRALNEHKATFMGKNGEITALLRGMKDIPPEEREEFFSLKLVYEGDTLQEVLLDGVVLQEAEW